MAHLPHGTLATLQGSLHRRFPTLLKEVATTLETSFPEYAEFLAGDPIEIEETGRLFVKRLISTAERGMAGLEPEPLSGEPLAQLAFEQIGRMQWTSGDELTSLLTAYHVGARVAWRHVSAAALDLRLDPTELAALAEAVFVFVNQLSAASAHGYVLEQSESAAARVRLREELAELLLSAPADQLAVHSAAVRAGWALPAEASVVLVDPADERGRRVVGELSSACLPVRQAGMFGVIAPSPSSPGPRHQQFAALRGAGAVVGHPVPLRQLPSSALIAQIVLQLKRDGVLTGDPIFAAENLDTIIVHRDAALVAALREQVLAPLDERTVAARERLLETLTAWLRHMGDRQKVAEELHVHPQTVRYRLAQLQEVFGQALTDPRRRARLFLALVWGHPTNE